MITISTKSWHYRYMDGFLNLSVPAALCPYVRMLLIALVMTLFIGTLGSFVAGSMLFTAAAFVNELVYQFFDPALYAAEEGHIHTGIALGFMFWVSLFIGVVWWGVDEARLRQRRRRWAKGIYYHKAEVKPDSLWVQWVKAKKAKLCPMIEFK